MTALGQQPAGSYWLPLAIAAGLVLMTAWLGQLAGAPGAPGDGVVGHDPDYFVEDFSAVAFDATGAPRYRLEAVRMTHYMDDDSSELVAPRFVREGAGMARVAVRSLRGRVSSNGEHVDFIGDVRMLHERRAVVAPLELSTEYLRVTPDAQVIESDRPVLLKDGRGTVHGGALLADGRRGTLELTGRVKGIYETRH